jgi:hypothetical protein
MRPDLSSEILAVERPAGRLWRRRLVRGDRATDRQCQYARARSCLLQDRGQVADQEDQPDGHDAQKTPREAQVHRPREPSVKTGSTEASRARGKSTTKRPADRRSGHRPLLAALPPSPRARPTPPAGNDGSRSATDAPIGRSCHRNISRTEPIVVLATTLDRAHSTKMPPPEGDFKQERWPPQLTDQVLSADDMTGYAMQLECSAPPPSLLIRLSALACP